MVFPGRFSTGCTRCRQRKVKCDEAKPTCRRCQIYGKPCPGYTDQFHFRYSSASTKPEKPEKTVAIVKSQKSSSSASLSSASSASSIVISRQAAKAAARSSVSSRRTAKVVDKNQVTAPPYIRARVSIIPPPAPSYDETSLAYFISRFVSPSLLNEALPGHLSFIPALYNHHNPGLLETATLSVAQIAAYNRFGGEKFLLQSYQNYGRAIRQLQDVIQKEDEVADDRVLATILLLCTFKDFNGEGMGSTNEHTPGLFYLLEMRGLGQLSTKQGWEMFFLALLRLQINAFLHEDDSYVDPGGIPTMMRHLNPLLGGIAIMSKILALRRGLWSCCGLMDACTFAPATASSAASPLEPTPELEPIDKTATAKAAALVKDCFETLVAFDNWDIELADFIQRECGGQPLQLGLGKIASHSTSFGPEMGCIIILVRSARLILLLNMLLYYSKMLLLPESKRDAMGDRSAWEECAPILENDVVRTIGDMLACVPYAMGDLDENGQPATMVYDGAAAMVIHPCIRLVTFCSYCTKSQMQIAKRTLVRLNSRVGIRSATGREAGAAAEGRWQVDQEFLRSMGSMRISEVDSPDSEGTGA